MGDCNFSLMSWQSMLKSTNHHKCEHIIFIVPHTFSINIFSFSTKYPEQQILVKFSWSYILLENRTIWCSSIHINNTRTRFPKAAHKVSARHSMKCRTHNFPTVFHQLFPHSTDVDGFSSCSCLSLLLVHMLGMIVLPLWCISSVVSPLRKPKTSKTCSPRGKAEVFGRPIGPWLSSSAWFHSPNNKLRVVCVFLATTKKTTLSSTRRRRADPSEKLKFNLCSYTHCIRRRERERPPTQT